MFSVVIPCYNVSEYIKECIDSVLFQSFQDFEILAINDGSTDSTLSILNSYEDERLKIISIENSGVSVARNTGINHAKNSYISFLDGDDWWHKDFLQETVNLIETFPDGKIFCSGKFLAYPDSHIRYTNPAIPKDGSYAEIDYFKISQDFEPPLNSSNSTFHKSILAENQFKSNMRKYEDHDLWLRLSAENSVFIINKGLFFYRKGVSQSATASFGVPFQDFREYSQTFVRIFSKIQKDRRSSFLKFFTKVMLYTLNNYGSSFSRKEREFIYKNAKKILPTSQLFLIYLSCFYSNYIWRRIIRRMVKFPSNTTKY